MKKYKSIGQFICILFFTVLLGGLCSRRIYLLHDHYCALATYYDVFACGGDFSNLGSKISIGVLLNCFFYNLFGNTVFTAVLMLIFPLIPCLFCASYLSSREGNRIFWISFPVLFFIFAPLEGRCDTWLNHQWESLVFLLIMIITEWFFHSERTKKQYYISILSGFSLVFYGIFISGSILVLIYVVVPFFVFFIKNWVEKKKPDIRVWIKAVLLLGAIIFLILSQTGLIEWIYEGYGGNGYMDWTPVEELLNNFMLSIKYTAESLGISYNDKTLLQGWTIIYVVKYFLFFYALYLCINCFIKGLKANMGDISPVDFLCSLCTICNLGANTIGTCVYSGAERYFSGAHYAMAILLCREIGRKLCDGGKWQKIELEMKRALLWMVCMGILGISFYESMEKIDKVSPLDIQITNYLVENNLQYGMGDFSNIYSFSSLSAGKIEGFSCYANEDRIDSHFRIPSSYYDLSNRYCFLYDTPHETLWNQETIEKYYGDYLSKKEFEGRMVYAYDYDIRWQQIMIDANGTVLDEGKAVDAVYEVAPFEQIEYRFLLPIGVSRLSLYGEDIHRFEKNIAAGENSIDIVKQTIKNNCIIYDISCDSMTEITVQIYNKGEQQLDFSYADLRIVHAAKKIAQDRTVEGHDYIKLPVSTKEQDIVIIIKGDRMKNIRLKTEQDIDLKIRKMEEGDKRVVYEISGMKEEDQDKIIVYNQTNEKINLEQVYYGIKDMDKLYSEKFFYKAGVK